MMRRKNWKRKMAFLLTMALTAGAALQTAPQVQAATDITQEAYEDIVGTYSIDPSVPGYQEYVDANPQVYPDREYRIAAVDYVRYEENGVSATPEIYDNYENIPGGGSALLTDEEALVEFEVRVEESGFYDLSLVYYPVEGKSSEIQRAFFVDGRLPYSELALVELKRIWGINVTEKAPDENGIEARVWQVDSQGNDVKHRQVIYITGVAPDKYRDYQLTASLPGLEAELTEARAGINLAIEAMRKTAGNNSDKLTPLITMQDQLDELIDDQERFVEVLSSYKTNVRACGNWITQVLSQPLQIDRIMVYSPENHQKIASSGFFSKLGYEIQRLFYSFIVDYNQIGNAIDDQEEGVVLTLWIGTGRDQANVIKALIDENFTSRTGINVNVQLVDMNTLLRATLADEGPDLAIQVANTNGIAGAVLNTGNDTPVNYGIRNAVLDLTQFSDFQEVTRRFSESSLVPFSFDGATYALPDTQTFPMMFYRKDILAEIGLDVPTTWDEVKVAMTVLSKNQMEFGMLPGEQTFAMLLFQNGGEYYSDSGDRSMLDSDISIATFKQYCEYYTDYKLDKATVWRSVSVPVSVPLSSRTIRLTTICRCPRRISRACGTLR